MKRTIAVTIDAEEEKCGRCTFHRSADRGGRIVGWCSAYGKAKRCYDNRLPACLAAEKAYKEATRGKA